MANDENLMPPARDKNDPRFIKMQQKLKEKRERDRLKKETEAQAKANLEATIQSLALDDLASAVEAGHLSAETINVALKTDKMVEEIEKIPMEDRSKDMNELWKFCMTQLKSVTGQEAAKKVDQTVDLSDISGLTKEELQKRAAAMREKHGHTPTVVSIKDAK